MKVMFYLIAGICLIMPRILVSQSFDVPDNYSFDKREDYKKYEPKILECIDFLETAPIDDESDHRKEINAFLMKWLTGTPSVSIELNQFVADLCDKNTSFLITFMGGWARFSLQNPEVKDKVKGHMAGLESIIKVYKGGKGVKKDKKVLKIIKMYDEAKLETWVTEQLQKK